MTWLYVVIIGAIIGWLAGLLMRGGGFRLLGNILLGILGSSFGSWLLGELGVKIGEGLVGNIITGVIGAAVLLFIAGFFTGGRGRI